VITTIFIIIFTVLSYYLARYLNNDSAVLPLYEQIEQFKTRYRSEIKSIDYLNHKLYYVINEENTFSGKVSYVTMAIKSLSNEKFTIEKIGWLRRFFIWLKLVKSPFYIQKPMALFSDEDTTLRIFEDAKIQGLLVSIFNEPLLYDTKKVILSNKNNEFSINFKLNKTHKLKEIKIEKFIEKYANKFVNIYEKIDFNNLEEKAVTEQKERLNSIRFGLFFVVTWGFFLSLIEGNLLYPAILNHSALLWLTFKLVLGVSMLMAMIVLRKVTHSIFKFSTVGKFFLFSMVSFFAISLLSIKYTNILFDSSSKTVTLTKMIKSKNKNSRTVRYYFKFEDNVEISVSASLYNSKKKGDIIYLSTKKGYLGLQWVLDVR